MDKEQFDTLHALKQRVDMNGDLAVSLCRGLIDAANPDEGQRVELHVRTLFPEEAPLPRAARRHYRVDDLESFQAFAHWYGDKEKSAILIDTTSDPAKAVLCLDETLEVVREYVTYPLELSPETKSWREALDTPMTQECLLEFLELHRDAIRQSDALLSVLREIESTATVRRRAKLDAADGTEIGLVFTSALTNEETARQIPTSLVVNMPVLREDVGVQTDEVLVVLQVVLPRSADESVRFRLRCLEWDMLIVKRIREVMSELCDALEGWPIMLGSFFPAGQPTQDQIQHYPTATTTPAAHA